MKKRIVFALLLTCFLSTAFAQKYLTRTGKITFFSSTALENIEARNNEVAAVLTQSGDIIFQVPIKSFKFQKQEMEEHFNEEYLESDKYPKADFKGKIENVSAVNFSKDGIYNVKVAGKLTIHGVAKEVSIPGTITVKGTDITVNSKFNVATGDYNVRIPSVMGGKIAKTIEVTVNCILNPVK
jgi:hypothetical protein